MKIKKVLAFTVVCIFLSANSWAYWVWSPEAGKFVNSETGAQDSAEEQYDFAMRIYREKDYGNAEKQFEELLKKFPQAPVAPEAQYRIGRIAEEQADFKKAFEAYKRLLKIYPQTDRLNEVVERQYRIGNLFLSGKKAKLMGLEILPSIPMAVEVFQHIAEVAPYSDYGDKARFRLGLSYKKWGRFDQAMEAFQAIIDNYPQSPFVADARFQIAECAYLKSSAQFRDQRALDEAAEEVDRFLAYYQDTTVSEKAAALRQQIDEKNAEKNYRIGLYYEKQDYLQSALIYYSDIAKRYPHTKWGQKAMERMKSLKEPVKYLSSEEERIAVDIKKIEASLKNTSEADSLERKQLERQLDRLKQKEKSIEKSKSDSLERRSKDIKRRERELREKMKTLEKKKKKMLKTNPSEDLKRAFDRWTASLETEQADLADEKAQLGDWRHELGVKQEGIFSLEFLPFIGESPSELEEVHQLEAKKFYKISSEKKSLLEEKELLYKQYSEVVASLRGLESAGFVMAQEELVLRNMSEGGDELRSRRDKLDVTRGEIEALEDALEQKRKLYEERFGQTALMAVVKLPVAAVTASAGLVAKSIDVLNPFDGGEQPLEEQSVEALLEKRMHLREKIAAQSSLTETLSHAFDAELALQERKRLLTMLEQKEEVDPHQLRRQIKRKEKDIRIRYEEIQDRHKKKRELLEELDDLLEVHRGGMVSQTARAVASPVVGFAKLGKAFLFGLPDRDVEITRSASAIAPDSAAAERALALKHEIELESLVIEAKSNELMKLQKELEILKAKASLEGGFNFRSAIVTVPYEFIREAVDSSKRLIPKKNRQEMLIQLLDQETRELDAMKAELKSVDRAIDVKTAVIEENAVQHGAPEAPAAPAIKETPDVPETVTVEKTEEPVSEEELALQGEIQTLADRLNDRHQAYEREKTMIETQVRALEKEMDATQLDKGYQKRQKALTKQEVQLRSELRNIEEEIRKLIQKENELEAEELSILESRIKKIDKVVQKIQSRAVTQDLLEERGRLEDRLMQLELRRDFLSREMDRFEIRKNP